MKQTAILVAALAVLVVGGLGVFSLSRVQNDSGNPGPGVWIANTWVRTTVVDTPETRERGLSGSQGLDENEGMLFVFPQDGFYGFWMKDMLFSIDIVWISADGEVVDMAQNVTPDTFPQSFGPERPARYVLELPAGWARTRGVQVGDAAEIVFQK